MLFYFRESGMEMFTFLPPLFICSEKLQNPQETYRRCLEGSVFMEQIAHAHKPARVLCRKEQLNNKHILFPATRI
jgi:hypothetical protein